MTTGTARHFADIAARAIPTGIVVLLGVVGCGNDSVSGRPDATSSTGPSTVSSSSQRSTVTRTVTATPTATPSQAATSRFKLSAVDWASVSVPGKECLSADPIHLAQGQARLPDTSYSTGYRLLSTESKSPVYGQLGGRTAAALYLTCSTGGGTAGDTIRDSYAVFTGSQGRLTVVGLITAQVEQANAGAATGLSDLQFQAGGITVREGYYLPDDGLCCPLGVARTTWSLTGNELVPNSPAQVAAGRAVSVHGTATGRDYEGVVWAHDLITDCADNAYGNIMIAFLRAHPCSRASRRLVTFAVNNRQVALSIISVEIPGTATDDFGNAGKFLQVEQADGTGGINDLLRDGSRIPDGPAAKTTSSSLRSAKSTDSEQKALCRVAHS